MVIDKLKDFFMIISDNIVKLTKLINKLLFLEVTLT